MWRRLFPLLLISCGASPPTVVTPPQEVPIVSLETLHEGAKLAGFTASALYVDSADQPLGARFVHDASGFVFDYLRMDTAPQALVWVNSVPTSDKGEPHTQEHLLLGKGDRGRRLGAEEGMLLVESGAYTDHWRTSYNFNTVGGQSAFWSYLDDLLDAMLHPDYTDLEIRREVANFGVTREPALALAEQGTIYNEMVAAYEGPSSYFQRARELVYGANHPLAFEAGGKPDAIWTMTPADIRAFHDRTYHLGNMGMIAVLPASVPLPEVLAHADKLLLARGDRQGKATGSVSLPLGHPGTERPIQVLDYPQADAQGAGSLVLGWPATRALSPEDTVLAELFLSALAGDESTTLYHRLIDSKTRVLETGATSVWSTLLHDPGMPMFIGLEQLAAGHLTESDGAKVRALVMAEIKRISTLPAGDPELVALDDRVKSRIVDLRRTRAKYLSTPPGFGFRDGRKMTLTQLLLDAEQVPGFRKSLALMPQLAAAEQVVSGAGNPWRDRLAAWGLTDEPFVVLSRPSPAERERLDKARAERIAAEGKRIDASYQTGLAQYAAEYDAATVALEKAAQAAPTRALTDDLPMSLDESLAYRQDVAGGIPTLRVTVPSSATGTVGLALRLSELPPHLEYLTRLFPALLSSAGMILDGKPVSAADIAEAQRREILGVNTWIDLGARSGRVELVIEGQGIDAAETARAVDWMIRILENPDWRPENVARLRDVVNQAMQRWRKVMEAPQETWVSAVRESLRHQDSRIYLHAGSVLTAAHDAFRLRWQLLDPGVPALRKAVTDILKRVGKETKDRAGLQAVAAALSAGTYPGLTPEVRGLIHEAGDDLGALLIALPDGSLHADWAKLCADMSRALEAGLPAFLADLGELRVAVRHSQLARLYVIGSAPTQAALAPAVNKLLQLLDNKALPVSPRSRTPLVAAKATYLGLVNPGTHSGAFVMAAPSVSYLDDTDDAVLDYLAANLLTGGGPQSLFNKTWAAGLAYSNGVGQGLEAGIMTYYADNCPDLARTMAFVVKEIGRAVPDDSLVRAAVAQAFYARLASGFEERGRAMASDLLEGVTPDQVRRFRTRLLAMARRSDLVTELSARFARAYARVLPGVGPAWKPVEGGVYLVVGSEAQLDGWLAYLRAGVDKQAQLRRLTPRDFWID